MSDGEQLAFTVAHSQEHAHAADINCVKFHPTQPDLLASASDDGTIKIWRLC